MEFEDSKGLEKNKVRFFELLKIADEKSTIT